MKKKKKAQLLSGQELLERLFSPHNRPSERTLIRWRLSGRVPFEKIGRGVWFDEDKVRAALERKNNVRAL